MIFKEKGRKEEKMILDILINSKKEYYSKKQVADLLDVPKKWINKYLIGTGRLLPDTSFGRYHKSSLINYLKEVGENNFNQVRHRIWEDY